MDDKNQKALFGLLALAIFVLSVFYLPKFFENSIPKVCIIGGNCQHEEYLNSVLSYIPLIIVLGFVFGIVAAYLYFEKKMDIPVPSPDKKKALLSMLNPLEAKILNKVLENNGEVLQADVSRLDGMGKVKAHRVIERLLRRGVLEKEQKGKINILRIRKDIKSAMEV